MILLNTLKRFKSLTLIFLIVCLCACSHQPSELITTQAGDIQGYEKKEVNYFLGVPFAKPPISELRWRAPVKPSSWQGVLKTQKVGPKCMQPTNVGNTQFLNLMLNGFGVDWYKKLIIKSLAFLGAYISPVQYSEDCLYLNVIAPKKAKDLPVMFWIHGGAGRFGFGGEKMYLSSRFAKKDVILVTINYRLGSLGWFAHPELSKESPNGVSGNYGTLDMIFALKWVKDNIKTFGGDSKNITIFGESAGGQAVATLLTSPLSKGLFHKAISQSGSGIWNTRELKSSKRTISAEAIGVQLASEFGVENNKQALKQLRSISAEAFIQLSDPIKDSQLISSVTQNIDGYVFPNHFHIAFKEALTHRVPYITGFNANEGSSLFPLIMPKSMFETTFPDSNWLERFWEGNTQSFKGDLPLEVKNYVAALNLKKYDAAAQLWGDLFFGAPAYYTAQKRNEDGLATYLYFFNRAIPSEKQTLGATHALELSYLFGSFFPFVAQDEWDHTLSDRMLSDWVSFAKQGKPNKDWPLFLKSKPLAKVYSDTIVTDQLKAHRFFQSLSDFIDAQKE